MNIKKTTKLNKETTMHITPKYANKSPNKIKTNILGVTPSGKVFCIFMIFPKVWAVYVIGIFLIVKVSKSSNIMGKGSTLGYKDSVLVEKSDSSNIYLF